VMGGRGDDGYTGNTIRAHTTSRSCLRIGKDTDIQLQQQQPQQQPQQQAQETTPLDPAHKENDSYSSSPDTFTRSRSHRIQLSDY
jgi:hypothetical protein